MPEPSGGETEALAVELCEADPQVLAEGLEKTLSDLLVQAEAEGLDKAVSVLEVLGEREGDGVWEPVEHSVGEPVPVPLREPEALEGGLLEPLESPLALLFTDSVRDPVEVTLGVREGELAAEADRVREAQAEEVGDAVSVLRGALPEGVCEGERVKVGEGLGQGFSEEVCEVLEVGLSEGEREGVRDLVREAQAEADELLEGLLVELALKEELGVGLGDTLSHCDTEGLPVA